MTGGEPVVTPKAASEAKAVPKTNAAPLVSFTLKECTAQLQTPRRGVKRVVVQGTGFLTYLWKGETVFPDDHITGHIVGVGGTKMPLTQAHLTPELQYNRDTDKHVSADPMFTRTSAGLIVRGSGRVDFALSGELHESREGLTLSPDFRYEDFNVDATIHLDLQFVGIGLDAPILVKARLPPTTGRYGVNTWALERRAEG